MYCRIKIIDRIVDDYDPILRNVQNFQKFNQRLEEHSKIKNYFHSSYITEFSIEEREEKKNQWWFRHTERYVSLNIFTGNFLFQTTMFEGRAALQVFGTGAGLLSQSDRGRSRYGWRGHRERAYLSGKSALLLLFHLSYIYIFILRFVARFIIRTRVKVNTRKSKR